MRHVKSFRSHPITQLYAYISEQVSDIQVVLTLVGEVSAGLGDADGPQIKNHLCELLGRATRALDDFDRILQSKTSSQVANATAAAKFSWRAWGQNAPRLKELSCSLRLIRMDISQTLTMITA